MRLRQFGAVGHAGRPGVPTGRMAHKVTDPVEPVVICNQLIRDAIVVKDDEGAVDPQKTQQEVQWHEVTCLSFSYKDILGINNLVGLDNLVKLKLDNNKIWKIQNLGHLVNLEWLDLSFNNIEKIEGLETLTKLTDLALFNNLITEVEGIGTLQELSALSLGNNRLENLDGLMCLRKIPSIRILNLDGNPICLNEDYRQYVLAHIKDLRYLDYRLVDTVAVQAARERYQDQILEIEEGESQTERERSAAAAKGAREKVIAEANLSGLDTLFNRLVDEDKDLKKVEALDTHNNMLEETIDEYRRDFEHAVEEFMETVTERRKIKVTETKDFSEAMVQATEKNMQSGISMIAEFDQLKKETFLAYAESTDLGEKDRLIADLRERNELLRDDLMKLEVALQEQVDEVTGVYYKLFKEVVDTNVTAFQDFFQKLRVLEQAWGDKLGEQAKDLMNTFNAQKDADKEKGKGDKGGDPDMSIGGAMEFDESLKALLGDKELLLGSIVASHENHGMLIDGLEDQLVNNEKKELESIMEDLQTQEHKRSRLRVSEVLRIVDEVSAVQIDEVVAADREYE